MRIKDMIIQDEFFWYFNNFFPLLYEKCMGARKKTLYFDLTD